MNSTQAANDPARILADAEARLERRCAALHIARKPTIEEDVAAAVERARRCAAANHTRVTRTPQSGRRRKERDLDEEIDGAIADMERLEQTLPPYYRDTLLPHKTVVIVAYLDVEKANIGDAEKWLATFKIVGCPDHPELEGEAFGKTLLRSWNPPRRGWVSPQHALAQDFLAVTGRRLRTIPRRPPRAIVGSFLADCQVLAETRVVARRMDRKERRWIPTHPDEHYSAIGRLVKLCAGCPRVLRRKQSESEPQS